MLVSSQTLAPSHLTRITALQTQPFRTGSPETLSEPVVLHLKTPQDTWLDKTCLFGKAAVGLQESSLSSEQRKWMEDHPRRMKEPCFPCAPSWVPAGLHSSPCPASLPLPQGSPSPGSLSSLCLRPTPSRSPALLRFFPNTLPARSGLCVSRHPSSIAVLQAPFLGILSPCPLALYHCHSVTCDSTQTISTLT